ncbi:MAG: hypothetical protein KDA27_06850 [Candidatus Eisenbacteria bacterium]|uniref:FecR domain-containing protein n=1 Tax=Eiseniibacteriota bacterium TaxID=2212470 RepID=A0A956NB12_UNCEI|nr:hypothetical protein [Candidatus Eisenbacteria bacterium]MCB9464124.1 hypothetical protein [Candidatus Eisenbacteria bacterium]
MGTLLDRPDRISARYMKVALGESLLAIVAALLFFTAFLAILEIAFPSGVGLRAMLEADTGQAIESEKSGQRRMYADGLDTVVGRLAARRNDVRTKAHESVVWDAAALGMSLHNRESVQTLDNAAATIDFEANGSIDLGPNTLVVLSDHEEEIFSKRRRSTLLVLDGSLRGHLSGNEDVGYVQVEVPAGNGMMQVRPAEGESGEVVFRIDVSEDRTATVTVESGRAEVVGGEDVLTIGENEAAQLLDIALPPSIVRLRQAPRISLPMSGQRFLFQDEQPEVELRWTRVSGTDTYHLIVARDASFEQVSIDRYVSGVGVVLPGLPEGSYYWSVVGVSHPGSSEELTSRSESTFRISRDTRPPKLEWQVSAPHAASAPGHASDGANRGGSPARGAVSGVPSGLLSGATGSVVAGHAAHAEVVVRVTGRAEAGSRVRVAGVEVTLDASGAFSRDVPLLLGPNVVSVEAIDRAGNVSMESRVVNRSR